MRKELKHYRIVSENGEALLIKRECFDNLLATLDVLAKRSSEREERSRAKK